MQNNPSTLIVGIGNDFRCDDGIGLDIARRLSGILHDTVEVKMNYGDGAMLMEQWQNYNKVILVDASSLSGNPGNISCFNLVKEMLPADIKNHSSHLFSVYEAIETAKVLNKLPPELIIFTIEGKVFKPGVNISEEVFSSSKEVIKLILQKIIN
jgi:hydrogenase maturation protease